MCASPWCFVHCHARALAVAVGTQGTLSSTPCSQAAAGFHRVHCVHAVPLVAICVCGTARGPLSAPCGCMCVWYCAMVWIRVRALQQQPCFSSTAAAAAQSQACCCLQMLLGMYGHARGLTVSAVSLSRWQGRRLHRFSAVAPLPWYFVQPSHPGLSIVGVGSLFSSLLAAICCGGPVGNIAEARSCACVSLRGLPGCGRGLSGLAGTVLRSLLHSMHTRLKPPRWGGVVKPAVEGSPCRPCNNVLKASAGLGHGCHLAVNLQAQWWSLWVHAFGMESPGVHTRPTGL